MMISMNNWCQQVSPLNSKQICKKISIKYAGKLSIKRKVIRNNHYQKKIRINFKLSNGCLKSKKSKNKKLKGYHLKISHNFIRSKLKTNKNHNRKSKQKDKV